MEKPVQKKVNDYLQYKPRSKILESTLEEPNMAFSADTKKEGPNADWETVGWINSTSKGSYTVKDKDNQLLGFVSKKKLDQLVKGEVKGAAISIPKKK